MKINYSINNQNYTADLSKPLDISIPLQAGNHNANCYHAEEPTFETIRFEGVFIGSVAEGGVCNYQRVSLTPHGNGTHTECYGHLNNQEKNNVTINQCLKTFWFVARLITLEPKKITEKELENGEFGQLKEIAEIDDEVILKKHLEKKLNELEKEDNNSIPYEALIIRTLPNSDDKKTRNYSGQNPPYLEPSIGEFLAQKNINHLLLDLPSVDKEWDKGKLSVHKGFWNILTKNTNDKNSESDFSEVRKNATITELIFVDNQIKDGMYLLNIQIPSLEIDAVPSKPVLYSIQ
ncbi:cyclase family protein [Bernardetia sp. OM2101]|uniref:cyclase family protein n=1 Tax=Bernardetia sp. OM2101 TaxID=3344876 RepID=UPI0035CFAFDE